MLVNTQTLIYAISIHIQHLHDLPQQHITIPNPTSPTTHTPGQQSNYKNLLHPSQNKYRGPFLFAEYPPRPSKVSDMSGSFYRHLTITVPVVSSIIVLVVVLCAVCFITRRRTSGTVQRTRNGKDGVFVWGGMSSLFRGKKACGYKLNTVRSKWVFLYNDVVGFG